MIDKFKKYDEFFITLKEESFEKIGPHAFSIIVRQNAPFTKEEFVIELFCRFSTGAQITNLR